MDKKEPIHNKKYKSILDQVNNDKKDIIRNQVIKELQELAIQDVSQAELDTIMIQFGTFASMQTLRIIALKFYGNKGNAVINEIIQSFISQGKSALMIKQEIDTVEQQESKLSTLLGDELIKKERELIAARVDKIYNEFETEIKSALLLDNISDDDTDDNIESEYPWE